MKSEIKYWEYIILTGKTIEPITNADIANYELALYNCQISRKKENIAA